MFGESLSLSEAVWLRIEINDDVICQFKSRTVVIANAKIGNKFQ